MRTLLLLLALLGLSGPAAATVTLQINGSGQPTGATGVDVGGAAYDVSVIDERPTRAEALSQSFDASTKARVVVALFSPSSVPEPATWAMMLLGFAAAGFALRRRKVRSYQFQQFA